MDVKTAFLNAPIDCELNVEEPEGFVVKGDGENLVLKLHKPLYGLKKVAVIGIVCYTLI